MRITSLLYFRYSEQLKWNRPTRKDDPYLEHVQAGVGPLGRVDQLDLAAGRHDNNLGGGEGVEEAELTGLHQALDRVHAPHNPQVVHHQEPGP